MKRRVFSILLAGMIAIQGIVPAMAELEEETVAYDVTSEDDFGDEVFSEETLSEESEIILDESEEYQFVMEESEELLPVDDYDVGESEEDILEEDLEEENYGNVVEAEIIENEIVAEDTDLVENVVVGEVETEEDSAIDSDEISEDSLEVDPELTGTSPGDLMSNPVIVSFNRTYTKSWDRNTYRQNHYCRINISQQGILTINATKPFDSDSEYGRLYFTLYDSAGVPFWGNDTYYGRDSASDSYSLKVGLRPGTYYLTIKPGFYVYSGMITTNYYFTFSPSSYCEIEPNESISQATQITLGNTYTGYYGQDFSDYEEYDFWGFNLTAGTTYKIAINNFSQLSSSTILIYVLDPEGNSKSIKWDLENRADSAGFNYVLYTPQKTGRHYLKMDNYSRTQLQYSIRIDQYVHQPKLIAAYNGANGIGIKFVKEPNAEEYVIYRKYNGAWSQIRTISAYSSELQASGNTLMYTDTSVAANYGQGFIYSVAAKYGSATTSFDWVGKAIYRLKPPTLTKGTNSSSGTAAVQWKGVFGRTETNGNYDLQYAEYANGKAGTFKSVTKLPGYNNLTLSAKVSGLKKGKKYVFRIRCSKTNKDRGTFYSEYSPWLSVSITR